MKRIIIVGMLTLFFAHLVACLWFLFAKLYNFSEDTWVARRAVERESASFQYLVSFYWAVQTITTVGFGDIPAKTTLEMLLSLVWMVFGVAFYSFVMGNFSSMLASIDSQKAILRKRIEAFEKLAEKEQFPEGLERRIKAHII